MGCDPFSKPYLNSNPQQITSFVLLWLNKFAYLIL